MIGKVDITAIKFNQASIVALTLVAFLLNFSWLVLFVALVLLVGTVWPGAALFKQIYQRLLKPAGLLKAKVVEEDSAPHNFAQGMAGTIMLVASLALFLGLGSLGWALAGLVALLAAVNLLFSFCAGCFTYFQLSRLGLFRGSKPVG
jgi:hypothetical protein